MRLSNSVQICSRLPHKLPLDGRQNDIVPFDLAEGLLDRDRRLIHRTYLYARR